MTEIILHEAMWVENKLAEPTLGKKPIETLSHIAKYYLWRGYSKKDTVDLLGQYVLRCDPDASMVKWSGTLEYIAENADKYPMADVDAIDITRAEMQRIEHLDEVMLNRLMFTLLCLAKLRNAIHHTNSGWVNNKPNDVFALANIKTTPMRQALMINDLWNYGYLGYSKAVDNLNVQVKIIDNESPVVLRVDDFRNLGNQYRRFKGEPFFACEECGLVIRKHTNNQRYCKGCAVDVHRMKMAGSYSKKVS